jgi:Domain of unknown function (DUF5658)
MLAKLYKLIFCSIELPKGLLFSMFLLLAVLNILDAISTRKVVNIGSNNNERNPLARFLFNKIGALPAMIILKGIALVITAYIAINYREFEPDIHTYIIIINAFYLWIVIHNFQVLKRLKSHQH